MARKELIRSRELPYHITARCNNREEFPGELALVWRVLVSELHVQYVLYKINIHAFVLMPNHFHLLVTSPDREIDLVMKEFLGSSTRVLNTMFLRSGHIFGGRYSWSLISEARYYAYALKYIYRNPVKAGLCEFVADHPYSTYGFEAGRVHLPFPLLGPRREMSYLVPNDLEAKDAWLNRAHDAREAEAIRKALRRRLFKVPTDRKTRMPVSIEL